MTLLKRCRCGGTYTRLTSDQQADITKRIKWRCLTCGNQFFQRLRRPAPTTPPTTN